MYVCKRVSDKVFAPIIYHKHRRKETQERFDLSFSGIIRLSVEVLAAAKSRNLRSYYHNVKAGDT